MQETVIRLIYGTVVLLGWGLSSFLMGLTGKQMHHSAALFYNLVGTILVVLCFSDQLRYEWSVYHFYGVAAGALICMADWAYYKLADHGMDVSLLGPVSSLYILTPVTLGVLTLNEPLSVRKVVGVLLALVAMYVLSTSEAQETKRKPQESEREKMAVPEESNKASV